VSAQRSSTFDRHGGLLRCVHGNVAGRARLTRSVGRRPARPAWEAPLRHVGRFPRRSRCGGRRLRAWTADGRAGVIMVAVSPRDRPDPVFQRHRGGTVVPLTARTLVLFVCHRPPLRHTHPPRQRLSVGACTRWRGRPRFELRVIKHVDSGTTTEKSLRPRTSATRRWPTDCRAHADVCTGRPRLDPAPCNALVPSERAPRAVHSDRGRQPGNQHHGPAAGTVRRPGQVGIDASWAQSVWNPAPGGSHALQRAANRV